LFKSVTRRTGEGHNLAFYLHEVGSTSGSQALDGIYMPLGLFNKFGVALDKTENVCNSALPIMIYLHAESYRVTMG